MARVEFVEMLTCLRKLKTNITRDRGPDSISRSRYDLEIPIRLLDLRLDLAILIRSLDLAQRSQAGNILYTSRVWATPKFKR